MTTKQRKCVIYLTVILMPIVGWLAYRLFYPKLYHVTILPSLGGDNTVAFSVNDRGQIVGAAQTPSGDYRLVLWDREHKLHELLPVDIEAFYEFDINNRGQIAGCFADPNALARAFLRDPNGYMRWFDPPAGTVPSVMKLNNRGQIVGQFKAPDGTDRIWMRDPIKGVQDLGAIGGKDCLIMAFNDRSQIFGRHLAATRDCPMFLWDPNNGVPGVYLDAGDLNNHSCLIGWRRIRGDGRYMGMWQGGRDFTKLFEGESGQFTEVIANDANQVLCGVVVRSRWQRFSKRLFKPWDTRILWDPDKGRVFLEKQLPRKAKGMLWPTGLNNHGCIITGVISDDKKRSQAIVMEPIPRRWRK